LKWIRYLFIFAALLFVGACSNNEETKKEKNEAKETMKQEEAKVEYPEAAINPEEIVLQQAGIKIGEAEKGSLTKEQLAGFMKEFETKGMSPQEIFNGLVHWFAQSYQAAYEPLRDFEPDFGELDISKNQEKKQKNIAIHLDASGSMAGHVPGGIKMDLAKSALRKYASGLPMESLMSLRVYGHKGTGSDSDKSLSCSSTEVMYQTSTYNEGAFTEALGKFKPSGWTPLAASINQAYEDLKATASENTENILFIVSDGIETCGGNPVEEARKLAESDLNIKVNIIGFNVDDAGQRQLRETAEAGNGEYFTVNSNMDLDNTITQLLEDARKGFEKNFEKATLSTKVNFRVAEISREINDLGSRFTDVYDRESRLLTDASYELYTQEKITEEENDAIDLLIEQRYEALQQFKETLIEKANEKKNKKHEELLSIISSS